MNDKVIFFLPYQENLNATDGTAPDVATVGCNIVTDEKPEGAVASLFCPSNANLAYSDLSIDFASTDDFTLDFYMRFQSSYSGISSAAYSSHTGFSINHEFVFYGTSGGGAKKFGASELIANQWAHYALVRKNGTSYWFINGECKKTVNIASDFTSKKLSINSYYTDSFLGAPAHYAFVRISNFARWTDDFTPPKPDDYDDVNPNPPDPDELNMHIALEVNETVDLTGYIHPIAPNVPQLVWSSDDSAIASVDQNGKVTGNAVGITKVHVKTPDNSWSALVRIIVEEEGTSDLRLSILLEPGETARLKGLFQPSGTSKPVVWSSSNPAVATVSSNGKVTALTVGESIITVQTVDGSLSDYIYITVIADKN